MAALDEFSEILTRDVPLAPHTWMKVGGPAQYFIEPRTQEELIAVLNRCRADGIPTRILGGGSNLLVRDEGVSGAVIRLSGDEFSKIEQRDETTVTARGGAQLASLISFSVKLGLAGLENLVGIPGTVGGALHGNAGGKSGEIGQFCQSVIGLNSQGELVTRNGVELAFAYRTSNLEDLLILEATFSLQREDIDDITRHMRTLWITKKALQPFSFQSAGCIFKNPRGMSAGLLIDEAGLKGTRIGHAEISERHANFIIAHKGATAQDVLRLIDLARSRISEQFGVDLELEIEIW
ncbi:MAG: UDP-N-acetylmuramate dehydrogenase [Planctomycetaceae bacterium]|nr:UDP-N-acetylmuramate dehydrogenase [Planctomycetaceae bacterium]